VISTDLNLKKFKMATLLKPQVGRFTSWKKGEVVKVGTVPKVRWVVIEKLFTKRPFLPLREQLSGVPRKDLEFL
jgi:hypothetical protein